MSRIIKLPNGMDFDMEQMEFRSPMGYGPVPINHSSRSASYNRSLWGRFSDFIADIGDWIADYSESITSIIAIIILIIGGIGFISWLFSLGLFWGIVAGIFLGGLAYYALMIIAGIFIWVGNIALGIVRYIFYNGWTFLLALAVVVGIVLYVEGIGLSRPIKQQSHIASLAPTIRYKCIVRVLNVRSGPGTNYPVIYKLRKGQVVSGISDNDGNVDFVKIMVDGKVGYVAKKYIISIGGI